MRSAGADEVVGAGDRSDERVAVDEGGDVVLAVLADVVHRAAVDFEISVEEAAGHVPVEHLDVVDTAVPVFHVVVDDARPQARGVDVEVDAEGAREQRAGRLLGVGGVHADPCGAVFVDDLQGLVDHRAHLRVGVGDLDGVHDRRRGAGRVGGDLDESVADLDRVAAARHDVLAGLEVEPVAVVVLGEPDLEVEHRHAGAGGGLGVAVTRRGRVLASREEDDAAENQQRRQGIQTPHGNLRLAPTRGAAGCAARPLGGAAVRGERLATTRWKVHLRPSLDAIY